MCQNDYTCIVIQKYKIAAKNTMDNYVVTIRGDYTM